MQIQSQKIIMPNVFQQEALKRLEETQEKRGVVVMPTGTGKTFLAVLWFKRILEKDKNAKLLFICHNQDILSQANEKEFQKGLEDFEIDYGYYNANEKDIKQVTFATTQTLTRGLNKFDKDFFDYVIVDESHHYQAKSFKKVVEYFNPKFLLGLTATPNRTDNKSIFKVLGKKIYEEKVSTAIKKGLLTKINYWCMDNDIDFTDVKWNGNNYDEKDLNRKICIKEYDDAILKEYNETLRNKFRKNKTICFCATVEHTHRMAKLFNENGIKAVGLTGKYDKKNYRVTIHNNKRNEIVDGFKNGKYDIIFVRDLFNEGVDVPDCDSIMMLRPTQSHIIFTQQIGRGLRKSEGKEDVLVLDFTGNARRCVINFEALGEMIELDIVDKVKSEVKERGKNEIEFINLGCKVRLSKNKLDVIKSSKIKVNTKIYSKSALLFSYKVLKLNDFKEKDYITMNDFMKYGGYSESNIRLHFGNYQNMLKELGEEIPIKFRRDLTKEEIIKEYYRVKRELKRRPIYSDFCYKDKISKISAKAIENKFGSFGKFLKEIGEKEIRVYKKRNNYTKKDLLEYYFKLKKELGRSPKKREFIKYTPNMYLSAFGIKKWSDFRKSIGDEIEEITKEDFLKNYNKIKSKLKKVPSQKEYVRFTRKKGLGINSILRIFGNYNNFLKKVGENTYYENKTNHYFENYKKCHKVLGHRPNVKEYNKITGEKYNTIYQRFNSWENFCNSMEKKMKRNIKIISKYHPKTIIPIKQKQKGNKNKSYEGLVKSDYSSNASKEDKIDIRERILSKIKDGDNVLLLESPDLTAIKEIERSGIKPKKIFIPNNLEFNKLAQELRKYKTDLNIECINTSALQYLVDSEEKFDFVWLDYCGAFSYYMKDLDILFAKHFGEMKLILTYNLFDPAKEDENYYFTRVIDYVLDKISGKSKIRLINDVTYRYKKNMYNIGFEIKKI